MLKKSNLSKYLYFLIIIFTFSIFGTFQNTYIILKNNYERRLITSAGYCDGKQGYGFLKDVFLKFPEISPNLKVLNKADFPTALGYFYNFKRKDDKHIVLLNYSFNDLQKYLDKQHKILFYKKNCYLLKND